MKGIRTSGPSRISAFVAVLVLLTTGNAGVSAAPPTVQDLAWGEVLFDFYQADHVPAITRLLVARQRGELPEHGDEAELVLGGLYLDYGMHAHAATIFESLLEQEARPSIRDSSLLPS